MRALTFRALFLLTLLAPDAAHAAPPSRAKISAALNYTALQSGQQAVVAVVVDVDEGLHAQSRTPLDKYLIKFDVKLDDSPAVVGHEAIYPEGEVHDYPALGKVSVYTGQVVIYVPIEVKPGAQPGPLKLTGKAVYQICDDKVCYPPERPTFVIETSIVAAGQAVQPNQPDLFAKFDPTVFARLQPATTAPVSTSANTTTGFNLFGINIGENSYLLAFAAAFVIGMIFNVMPCVLPVVPLKAMGFYEVSQHHRGKSLALGVVFSAGLIASFGVLAIVVVVQQSLGWGELFSKPWFVIPIVIILLAMAVGTFGVFTVNLPQSVYRFTPRHDTYVGNFLFGILTAVLSTPCTFGMFLGLLAWAAKAAETSPAIGVSLVMTVGVGMAFPYFVLSAFPELARRFPRTGPWAELVKQMMAFLLLGTALFFAQAYLQRITGADGFWWVLFGVVVAAAIFLVARTIHFSKRPLAIGVAVVVGVLMVVPSLVIARHLTSRPYEWAQYSDASLADAKKSGVTIVEFTATWCGNCHYLEATVLKSKPVVAQVEKQNIVMLKADLTAEDAPGWPLLKKLNPVAGIPFTAVYSPHLSEPIRLSGVYSTEDLLTAIEQASKTSVAVR